jgi:hypothetical protein
MREAIVGFAVSLLANLFLDWLGRRYPPKSTEQRAGVPKIAIPRTEQVPESYQSSRQRVFGFDRGLRHKGDKWSGPG